MVVMMVVFEGWVGGGSGGKKLERVEGAGV